MSTCLQDGENQLNMFLMNSNIGRRIYYSIWKKRKKKAIAFKAEDIKKIKDGEYQVVFEPNSCTVSIGDDVNLPSCQCRQFQKTRIPCKHFLSVFRHSDVSFESLPDKYRNNPIFSIDLDCLGIHLSNVRSCA